MGARGKQAVQNSKQDVLDEMKRIEDKLDEYNKRKAEELKVKQRAS
jgi:hypothetical protein